MADRWDPKLTGGLLGLFVHDLRNPLSALLSNASFLQSLAETSSDDVREALADVTVSCEALGYIIDNLELLSLALRDEHHFEMHSFGLHDLIVQATARAQSFAASYGVTLDLSLDPGADLKVNANREMLDKALGNLLMNAIQHAVNATAVRVSARSENASAVVVVEDSGVALSAELGDGAFTAQGQLDAKNTNAVAGRYGRGLGLLSARLAAEAAGARVIHVAAREGGGNAFELHVAKAAGALYG